MIQQKSLVEKSCEEFIATKNHIYSFGEPRDDRGMINAWRYFHIKKILMERSEVKSGKKKLSWIYSHRGKGRPSCV